MVGPLTSYQGGLVRCFTAFVLLPDLLRNSPGSRWSTDESWEKILDTYGYDDDHIDLESIPDGAGLTDYMASDAYRFCEWMKLVDERGRPIQMGLEVVRRTNDPSPPDVIMATHRELPAMIARQIQDHYRGAGDLPVVDLLQRASAALASPEHDWPDGLYGLLLVELATLLHWAFIDRDRANRLVEHLPEVRREVMAALRADPEVVAGRESIDEFVVAEVHWGRQNLLQESDLSVMEVRSTAMAMVYSELLLQTLSTLPLQVLRPPGMPEDAR